jgi:hypothetical protein
MGTDGACGLLFCAAKRSGTFPPNMRAGLRARVSRLGGFRAAPNYMPEVVSDSSYNFKKMLESCPQEL